MPRIEFEWFDVEVPDEWGPVKTRDTYDGPKLTGTDRAGWLLFQVTPFEPGGPWLGDLSTDQLAGLVRVFGETRDWGSPTNMHTEEGPPRVAGGSFTTDDGAFVRVWHVMDGRDYACVFYRSDSGEARDDLPLCEQVIRSLVVRSEPKGSG